jgi:hypothetical protein
LTKAVAYVDAPELLDAVKANDLLQQLVPVLLLSVLGWAWLLRVMLVKYLSTWRLGEPEGPGVGERVLDIEVLGVVEDSDNIARVGGGSGIRGGITTLGRDGDGVERDGGLSDFGHDEMD